MEEPQPQNTSKDILDRRSAIIAAGMMGIIGYGSLYPFHFWANPDPAGPLVALLSTWSNWTNPADVIANVLFYLPLGFFFSRAFPRRRGPVCVVFTAALGFALSVTMESLQFYVIGRDSAMSDVYSDVIGITLGALAGYLSRRFRPSKFLNSADPFPKLLLVTWCLSRLYPYVPVIDLHKYWDALKPLIYSPAISPLDLGRHLVTWLVAAELIESLLGRVWGRFALVLLLPSLLITRIFIAEIALSPDEILGGVAGIVLWLAWLSRITNRTIVVTGLFLGNIVVQGLAPFYLLPHPRPFGWIPFRSFLRGSAEFAVPSFLEKAFTYGSLVWLLTRSGLSWTWATALGAGVVFVVRVAQVYLPGRSAEITDVVMLLIMAVIMRLMLETGEDPSLARGSPSIHLTKTGV
jgi:VanZ family protein